jgi:hypothetical protein
LEALGLEPAVREVAADFLPPAFFEPFAAPTFFAPDLAAFPPEGDLAAAVETEAVTVNGCSEAACASVITMTPTFPKVPLSPVTMIIWPGFKFLLFSRNWVAANIACVASGMPARKSRSLSKLDWLLMTVSRPEKLAIIDLRRYFTTDPVGGGGYVGCDTPAAKPSASLLLMRIYGKCFDNKRLASETARILAGSDSQPTGD